MTITTILIVLGVLILLFLVSRSVRKNSAKTGQQGSEGTVAGTTGTIGTTTSDEIPGEVLTAIFMALHEEQEDVHDFEHTVLTLNPVNENYSPWSAKAHGLRELPRR